MQTMGEKVKVAKVNGRAVVLARTFAALGAVSLMVGACGGPAGTSAESGGTPQQGGEIVMAINTEGKTMDPAWCATMAPDRCAPVFGTLLQYDSETDKFVPSMAESFESQDGQNWTLKLREGVTFTDGTPFDAEAVAFNWARLKDPATLSAAAPYLAPLTWRVVDPQTLEVTSEHPNFNLPAALTAPLGMIASPTAITEKGADFGNQPIGAGPFVLDNWTRNAQAKFTANPNYWGDGPYIDSFVLKVVSADDQRMNTLRAGEVNVAWSLQSKDAAAAKAEGFTVHELPLVGGTGVNFNLSDPIMQDEQLHTALLHAIDSKQIVAAVYPADTPADAFLFSDSPFRDDALGVYPAANVAEAQKLFDAYLKKSGKSDLTITLSTYAGIPDLDLVSQLLQSQLQEIHGLTVNIDAMDFATLEGKRQAGTFEMALGAQLSQDIDMMYDVFHTGGSKNITKYSNPDVDKALETTRVSQDPDEVSKAYAQVNGAVSKDGPMRTFRYQHGYIFTSPKVHDLTVVGSTAGAGVRLDRAWIAQ
ncbi:UNVERIFIED_CONTAM: peptide/nickel transport system substrate-binding protein [Williamsia faeni]